MTRTLWFKQRFVDSILCGTKTSTIRGKRPRFDPGDIVSLHVGPRPRFAVARILWIHRVQLGSLDRIARKELQTLYGASPTLWQIAFQLISDPSERQFQLLS